MTEFGLIINEKRIAMPDLPGVINRAAQDAPGYFPIVPDGPSGRARNSDIGVVPGEDGIGEYASKQFVSIAKSVN